MTDADGADWPPLPPGRYKVPWDFNIPTHVEAARMRDIGIQLPDLTVTELRSYASIDVDATEAMFRELCGIKKPWEKENVNEADKVLAQEIAEKQVQTDVERKRSMFDGFGPDRYSNGTVIRFQKQFAAEGAAYTYAAIKVNGSWYTTGPRGNCYTWDSLKLWLVSGDAPTDKIELLMTKTEWQDHID